MRTFLKMHFFIDGTSQLGVSLKSAILELSLFTQISWRPDPASVPTDHGRKSLSFLEV